MVTILLDPAHGGTIQHGKSTPAGRTLLDGSNEKAATWELAQRVLTQLGSGVGLTRAGEDNPSLAQRIAGARDSEAKVFVSIHARSTGPSGNGSRGHETWIHTQGSFSSLALARAIARELGSVGANGQVYRGELAVLTPNLHAPDTAACLVEVDVGLGTDLDGASAAIARAVQSFLGGGQPIGLGLRRRQRTGRGLSVVTPAYSPQSDQDALAAFVQWQADANNFLIGVPPGAHDYFPHCAIAHLQLHFSDGSSGGGTGFFVAEDLVLTAAHCLFDIATGAYLTSVEVYPGQANNTPANSFTVSGAGDVFRTHPGYNGDASFDLGLIRTPRGQYAGPYFQTEEQNQSYTPGTILVCGYAAHLTAKDQEVLQMCATIDRNVQHLSADTIQQLIENEQAFTYSLQTLAGTSGAPVFYAAEGAAHTIGVHHGANDATTNKGCRLTQEKIQWIHGSWNGSQWPPAAGYGRRGLGAARQPARPGRSQPAPPQQRSAPPANVRYGAPSAGFPQPPGASEVYGRPTAAPRRASATPRPSVARRPMARAQVGVLRPPQYSPGSSQQSLDSLRIWQGELQRFLSGVPNDVHGYYPHRSICKLFLDGGGEGSGFWIGGGKILTAGHCVDGVSSIRVAPGHCRDSTVWEIEATDLRKYPGYAPAGGLDIGIIKLPSGHRFDEFDPFVLEDLNQCPVGGLIVCGYASLLTAEDEQATQSSMLPIDGNIQHLSSGGFDLSGDEAFTLYSNLTQGTSGSPVFYVGDDGMAHAVGIAVAAITDGSANIGARLTQQKINWINAQ